MVLRYHISSFLIEQLTKHVTLMTESLHWNSFLFFGICKFKRPSIQHNYRTRLAILPDRNPRWGREPDFRDSFDPSSFSSTTESKAD